LILIDQIASGLGMLSVGPFIAKRPYTPANAVARLHHRDRGAAISKIDRRGETGQTGAGDEH
jgi:hypothetical protein